MTDHGQSRVWKHGKAATLYLSIPAKMAVDSQCPVKEGDRVRVEWNPATQELRLIPIDPHNSPTPLPFRTNRGEVYTKP